MAYTSEIEKLERRYAENPKGRNFAPLADAYRKAGQLDQAIELCKSGLERHPDYVSAHIVYGRCLMDQKDDRAAEGVFRKVLELDPENVIAFKVLADLSERQARHGDTVQWLTRLLAADPMNDDAAEALAQAKRRAAEAAPPAAPVVPAVPAVAAVAAAPIPGRAPAVAEVQTAATKARDLGLERGPVVTRIPEPPAPPAPPAPPRPPQPPAPARALPSATAEVSAPAGDLGLETFDGTIHFDQTAPPAGIQGIQLDEEVTLTPARLEVEGLARTQYEGSGMFKVEASAPAPAPARETLESGPKPERAAAPIEPPVARALEAPGPVREQAEELPTVDLPLIMPDEVATARRSGVQGGGPRRPSPPPPPPPPPSPPRRSVPAEPIPAAVVASDDDGAADTAALSRVEPVLTETMAELYLRQGHKEDALRVYQALLAQRPGDPRLAAKIDTLSPSKAGGASRGQTVRAFLHEVFSSQPRGPAPRTSGRVAVTETSLSGAFARAPSDEIPGMPSYQAGDALSLDQVFGDDAGRMSRPLPPSPAPPPPAPSPGPPSSVGQRTAGFSFDEFFAAGSGPGAPAPAAGAAPAPPPPRARPSARARAAEDEADLDQFQAWLKGLKA